MPAEERLAKRAGPVGKAVGESDPRDSEGWGQPTTDKEFEPSAETLERMRTRFGVGEVDGAIDEAIADLQRSMGLPPNNVNSYIGLGRAYAEAGYHSDAVFLYQHAGKLVA